MFNKVIRVFLSSTFKDMAAERDAFHGERVFGRLRTFCETRGFQFQIIDLRWGVTNEAAWDQRTEEICLEEIRRCRNITPRPNFVALVGQRYGWRPLPRMLTEQDWELLHAQRSRSLHLLHDWYKPDRNNVPSGYCLRPRITEREQKADYWLKEVEIPLRELLIACVDTHPDNVSQVLKTLELSLTEKEIRQGAENAKQKKWQAFAYFRQIAGVDRSELDEPYVDRDDSTGELSDPRSGEKLQALRARLESNNSVTVRTYETTLILDVGGTEGVERAVTSVAPQSIEWLCESVYGDLKQAIERQIIHYENQDPLEREVQAHLAFGRERRKNYVPRLHDEERGLSYFGSDSETPFILAGLSGAGKTALVASLSEVINRKYPAAVCITRFIGATGDSGSLRPLLRSIHDEAARRTDSSLADESMENNPLVLLRSALELGSEERPIFIILDALDQLAQDSETVSCAWVPRGLPTNSRLLLTCMIPSEGRMEEGSGAYEALKGRQSSEAIVKVVEPDRKVLRQMYEGWLRHYGRTLTPRQFLEIDRAVNLCPRPLYIRVLTELTRHWTSDFAPPQLPTTIEGIISAYLDFVEKPSQHGRTLVTTTLGYLVSSREGLTENELIDLLSTDLSLRKDFENTSRYEYPDSRDILPPAIWSRILSDLDLFLGDTTTAGISLVTFYHRQFERVARARYCGGKEAFTFISTLAQYFEGQNPWISREERVSNARRAFELAFQLQQLETADTPDRLRSLLKDNEAICAKISAGLSKDLLRDYLEIPPLFKELLPELAAFFAEALLVEGSPVASAFPPDILQSFFAYQRDRQFYRKVLEYMVVYAAEDISTTSNSIVGRMRIDLAGIVRRERGFERARELLRFVSDENSTLPSKDLSVGWYEIGYIQYLEDDYAAAIHSFRTSAAFATKGDDQVGARISQSVEMWARYFHSSSPEDLDAMYATGLESLAIFMEKQHQDPRAARWVMNALAHMINVSYLQDDSNRAENHLRDLRASPWIREFESPDFILPYEARTLMAKGAFADAKAAWEGYLRSPRVTRTSQAVAWPMLDYGITLDRNGKLMSAALVFEDGLNTDKGSSNNRFWHKRIQERQAVLPWWAKAGAKIAKKFYRSYLDR